MSFYSSIDRRINADKWFRDLSHLGQLLWFRLLTGPHVTPVAGLWPATEDGLARAFKMSIGLFRKTYAELATKNGEPTGKVFADWDAGVIWFPRAIHVPANQPRNENVLIGWVKHLELVPECDLRDRGALEIALWVNSLPNRFPNGLPKGFPKPLAKQFGEHVPRAKQEQEQEQEQDQEQEQEQAAQPSAPDKFSMRPDWEPKGQTVESFRVGLIPEWAIGVLVARYRSHFCSNPEAKRTDVEWNQACSKWVFGDWNNPKKRPKKPENDPNAETIQWAD